MRTFLDRLHDLKQKEITKRINEVPEKQLRAKAEILESAPEFRTCLLREKNKAISLIAEVKSRAPGRNNVESLELDDVVSDYETGGAKAISVLTDETWFGGSLETLEKVSSMTALPLLHKEFIISPYQLLEGRTRGASAALILAYYFQEKELHQIVEETKRIGLEAVVECSLVNELPRALAVNPDILMINNRAIAAIPEDPAEKYDQGSIAVISSWWESFSDLRSWKKQRGKLLISASCIHSIQDIISLSAIPCDAALIGNAAMTAEDRIQFLQSLNKTA
ncbi:MAG: indole-3-glycerol phosphate synthase [SAR324 cluster bacterium]|nr:indole-3-glycerol phosphate synthase [SAR324 cluster bacterium]MBL7035907.1 indole-3-glycerol phosphate synthase [SAR324 cluster bacterium]